MIPPEDKALDDYLSGGSDLSHRYRSIADQQPPAALDDVVLAQARAAIQAPAPNVAAIRQHRYRRYIAPVAVAATMLLTFAIFREAGLDATGGLQAPDQPAIAAAKRDVALLALPQKTQDAPASSAVIEMRADERQKRSEARSPARKPEAVLPPAVPASPAPAAAPSKSQENQTVDMRQNSADPQEETARSSDAMRPDSAPSSAPVAAARTSGAISTLKSPAYLVRQRGEREKDKSALEPVAPEEWLEQIRHLRAAGQRTEAQAELKRFLEIYPDYFVKNPTVMRP